MASTAPRITPERLGDLDCWRIHTPHGTALMARQGAQLLSYATTDGRPVIWLSDRAEFKQGKSLRGGVPVCWPWFGVYARNPQAVRDTVNAPDDAPSHGLVRGRDWTLASQSTDEDSATLEFACDLPQGLGPWKYPVSLRLTARFGKTVHIAFSMHNPHSQALTVSLALHTYLAVSDCRQVSASGLENHRYLDTLTPEWATRTQAGPIQFTGETDRIYLDTSHPIDIHDPRWQRTLRLTAQNSRSTVVWNPWVDKTLRLPDMAPDAWQDMICIETARIMDDVLTVAPGATETVSLEIAVA